jgi:hypothetical protein
MRYKLQVKKRIAFIGTAKIGIVVVRAKIFMLMKAYLYSGVYLVLAGTFTSGFPS